LLVEEVSTVTLPCAQHVGVGGQGYAIAGDGPGVAGVHEHQHAAVLGQLSDFFLELAGRQGRAGRDG
jgi:hypothetical protein